MCVCVCICHIFFIHSPDDKHLGCFNTLVAVNRAVMNVGVHVSFRVSVLLPLCCCLDIYPGVEFLGHGSSISNFLRNLQAVFHSDCTNLQSHLQWRKVPFSSHPCQHFFFLTFYFVLEHSQLTMLWSFQVSRKGTHPCIYLYAFSPKFPPIQAATLSRVPCSSPIFVICVLFDDSHSDRCEVMSHCGFNLHFPDDLRSWASFHVDHLHFLFGKMSIKFFCPFFYLVVCFFDVGLYELFIYIEY